MSASVFFLILAVLICTFVVIQVRNQHEGAVRRPMADYWYHHYCVGCFPESSEWCGILWASLPVNLLFLLSILLLMGGGYSPDSGSCRLSEDPHLLAEEVAILKALQEQPEALPVRKRNQQES